MALIAWSSSRPAPDVVRRLPEFFGLSSAHLAGYAWLGLLLIFALSGTVAPRASTRRRWLWALAIGTAWGLLDEIHQAFVPTRTASAADVAADALGTALGAAGALIIARLAIRRAHPGPPPP